MLVFLNFSSRLLLAAAILMACSTGEQSGQSDSWPPPEPHIPAPWQPGARVNGPVFTCTIFNDDVVKVKLGFVIDSQWALDLWQRYEKGQTSSKEILREATWEHYYQNDKGKFIPVSEMEWRRRLPRNVNYDMMVEVLALPADFAGDIACTVWYIARGKFEDAAYSAVAIVIPFANGAMIRGGKYLVRIGKTVEELTPKQIWKLKPWQRGELIEDAVVKTRYAPAGFSHMAEASRWWPIFDVVKGDLVVSIKTTNATKGWGSLIDNLDELDWLVKTKKGKNGGVTINQARMDIYVPDGYDNDLLEDVRLYGASLGIPVNIATF